MTGKCIENSVFNADESRYRRLVREAAAEVTGSALTHNLLKSLFILALVQIIWLNTTAWARPGCDLTIHRGPTKIVKPEYPALAVQQRVEGHVDLEFIVEPDGSVGNPHIVAELPKEYGFGGAAMAVFSQWKFPPILGPDCKAVPTAAFYRMTFKLQANSNVIADGVPK